LGLERKARNQKEKRKNLSTVNAQIFNMKIFQEGLQIYTSYICVPHVYKVVDRNREWRGTGQSWFQKWLSGWRRCTEFKVTGAKSM